jgi:hypothetical protein
MPTPTSYTYAISPVNIDQFTANIEATAIVTAIDHLSAVGTSVSISFKDALSVGDKALLDACVASYVYEAPHQPTQKVEVTSQPSINILSTPAFASKMFGNKSLYKRVVGKKFDVVIGENVLLYTETFPWVKFMALEIVNGDFGDTISLYVLDTATGTYSTIPNYQLNQFGFSANIAPGFYQHKSEFDADVYAGLQIKIVYTSISAKTVGVNYVMNEVK